MAKLAINGGSPAITDWVPSKWPIFDDRDRQALLDTLESGNWCCFWSENSKVAQFEKLFSEYIGTKYATCVNSGTASLELAFRSCDIEPGDEVIVTAVSFVASASAIVLAGECLYSWTLILKLTRCYQKQSKRRSLIKQG